MTRTLAAAATLLLARAASAQATDANANTNAPATPPSNATPTATAPAEDSAATGADERESGDVASPGNAQRKRSVEPKPAEPPPPRTTFDSDPIADGAIIGVALGFAGILDLINSTGEVRPQQVPQNFDRNRLLGIDRGALSQTVDPNAATFSNIGLVAALAFAAADPILSGLREDSVQSGLVDGIMYAESISLTFGLTNLAKVAVRRPRPSAYLDAEAHKDDPSYANTTTDSSLSFFSGHAAITATVGATATYLAFVRSKNAWRPWITLIVASAVTAFTSVERVRAGAHFPTDVIAGSIAGAGVGIIVPHLHRSEDAKQRRVWVGYAPVEREGGTLTLTGLF